MWLIRKVPQHDNPLPGHCGYTISVNSITQTRKFSVLILFNLKNNNFGDAGNEEVTSTISGDLNMSQNIMAHKKACILNNIFDLWVFCG